MVLGGLARPMATVRQRALPADGGRMKSS